MIVYYKREWDENRGDGHADWGTSMWFFEVGEDGFPTRQIEVYQSGVVLRYDEKHPADEFGGLAAAPLDPEEFSPYLIGKDEFEAAWSRGVDGKV